jgi:hypothetical protein
LGKKGKGKGKGREWIMGGEWDGKGGDWAPLKKPNYGPQFISLIYSKHLPKI